MCAAKGESNKPVQLAEEQLRLIAKGLADPRRFDLLRQIGGCPTAVECGEIKRCHPISAATLSHHMKELVTAGLVRAVREGKFVSYTMRREIVQAYMDQLAKL